MEFHWPSHYCFLEIQAEDMKKSGFWVHEWILSENPRENKTKQDKHKNKNKNKNKTKQKKDSLLSSFQKKKMEIQGSILPPPSKKKSGNLTSIIWGGHLFFWNSPF